jgi:hypothetical protein
MNTPVTIEIDGKSFEITVGTNDLIQVEELTGRNMLMGMANLVMPDVTILRALLFVTLRKAGATYTLPEVGGLITIDNIITLRDKFLDSWQGQKVG